ncbi:MAG: inositol-3-phosphate synthase [Magnetococcales bacterium]|nr:inositol-3-phosphate synthase [Magnetococcales bacterium]
MDKSATKPITIAIAGVGNCASALIQGIPYYRGQDASTMLGVMRPQIGPWGCGDIQPVAAFDIDARKVGESLESAIFAAPNCAHVFQADLPASGVTVQMGPVLDGVADHMGDHPEERAFRPADRPAVDVTQVLQQSGAQVLVCFLPVGSDEAVRHYAECCLEAGVAMINCVPTFIASDPEWAKRFQQAGLPIIGDDIKSQVGATIVHRQLARLFSDRGCTLRRTYQLNTGGNTDFLNMLAQERLGSKKISKTQSVQSQLPTPLPADQIHIGPSDYVPWQKDNKVCFLRMEGEAFGGAPVELELRLSVQDSPNSAGVVIDAIRCAGLALQRSMAGALTAPCACYMKSPPRQFSDAEAQQKLEQFIKISAHANGASTS